MLHIFLWTQDGKILQTKDPTLLQKSLADPTQYFWLDLDAPTEEELSLLDELFHFHPLAIKAVKELVGIPKIDIYENYILLVLHRVFYHFESEECELREFEVFFSERFIVTIHPTQLSRTFQSARDQVQEHPHELGQHGTSYLLFRILSMAIQDHKPAIKAWQDMLDKIEEKVFQNVNDSILENISEFKKLVSRMRKSLLPEYEVLKNLYEDKEVTLIVKKIRPYFKMVLDNMNALLNELDSLRDHANSIFDIYAAMLTIRMHESSNQLNFIMQRLTIAATIFLPLTFIASIYGMNFKFMPELQWKWGYILVLGIMVVSTSAMIYFFRRKKWL